MSLFKLPVNRPTTVTMFFFAVFLFGIISLKRLPQELFPSFEYPQITVVTKYSGAGPEEAEKLLSKIIEETVGTAKNLRKTTSISKEGTSIVICEFHWGTDVNLAALDVREKIDLIKERLPKDAQEPIVLKYNPFRLEAMSLSVSYKTPTDDPWKLVELRILCKKHIKDELERLEGVGKVELYGGAEKEILVEVDKGRLMANQLALLDIIKTLRETNITYPAGTIKEEKKEFTVKTVGEFKDIEDIRNVVIPVIRQPEYDKYKRYRRKKDEEEAQKIIYLSDVAEVKESIKDITGYSRYNGKNHVSISIFPQSKANLINLSKSVKEKLKELKKTKIPENVEIKIVSDQAEFIKSSLNGIYMSALQGGVLAFIILFLFLKDIVASIIIIISIPLAILATLTMMYFSNISVNTMSLGGLALGVGMLVDNSIVVLEKIFAEKEKEPNRDKKDIISYSTSHVVNEIISSTLTTVAIFLPLVFVGGVIGKLFKELALTVSFSLISSILVALFLVPRLALWLNLERYVKLITQKEDKITNTLRKFPKILKNVLDISYKKNYLVVFIYLIIGLIIFSITRKEFVPKVDERKFVLNITLPSTTTVETTNEIVKQIEKYILSLKETDDVIVNIGSTGEEAGKIETLGANQARIILQLKKTGRPTDKIVSLVDKHIKSLNIKNIETEFITQQGLYGTGIGASAGIVVEVKGSEIKELESCARKIAEYIKNIENTYGIKVLPSEPASELKLEINRERASLFGISITDISATILAGIKGYSSTKFRQKEDEFDTTVRLRPEDRADLSSVGELTVYSPILNKHIYLSQLSEFKLTNSPPEIRRSEGQRVYYVYANTQKGFGKVVKEIKQYIEELKEQQRDLDIKLAGETLAIRESLSSSLFALALGIIVIYMILASQFESLIQPVIVMTTIPLGLIGAMYGLFLTFNSINSVSMLGFIMLIGIVVNNGIILVSEYNFVKENNPEKNLIDMVIEVTTERLRPILMTTLTTVLGLLPLALSRSVNSSMANSILSGLTLSLFLTLFFVPMTYLLLVKKKISQV